MRPLVIGEQEKADIKRVMDYAKKNVMSRQQLIQIVKGFGQPPGDNPNFVTSIPFGYRVVYSLEMQLVNEREVLTRHMSVSIVDNEKYPSVSAVQSIGHEFGFIGDIRDMTPTSHVWVESDSKAINWIQLMEPVAVTTKGNENAVLNQ